MDRGDEPIIPIHEQIVLVNNNDPSVVEIELSDKDEETVSEYQMVSLLRGLQETNTHVRKLDLFRTPRELKHTVCVQLLPLLLRGRSSIQYVGFPRDMTSAEFLPSAEILGDNNNNNNATVETVDLSGCDIVGHEGGEIIARLMRNNCRVTTIDLCYNRNLGPAGATCIAEALSHEDCELKALYLAGCNIRDAGVAALCAALVRRKTALEVLRVSSNGITEDGYRALAISVPLMSALKEIEFRWEPSQVPAEVLRAVMEGLRKNRRLQAICTANSFHLSEEQRGQWNECCKFVCARNCRLMDEARRNPTPAPIPIGPLLHWCCRDQNAEVRASSIHLVLRSRVDEFDELAAAAAARTSKKLRRSKRRRREVDYLRM